MTIYNTNIIKSKESNETGKVFVSSNNIEESNYIKCEDYEKIIKNDNLFKINEYKNNYSIIEQIDLIETKNNIFESNFLVSISKNENETYIIIDDSSYKGMLYKIENNDFDNPIFIDYIYNSNTSSLKFVMCFKNDVLYILNNLGQCRALDSLNNIFLTDIIQIEEENVSGSGGLGDIMAFHYNKNLDEIVLILRFYGEIKIKTLKDYNSLFQLKSYAENNINFSSAPSYNNIQNLNKNGTINYYDQNYYFMNFALNSIIKINEIDFKTEYVFTFAEGINFLVNQLQVTENGVFFFPFSYSDGSINFIYSNNLFKDYKIKIISEDTNSLSSISYNLINDNFCVISTNKNIYYNYNISNSDFNLAYNSSTSSIINLNCINNNQLNIFFNLDIKDQLSMFNLMIFNKTEDYEYIVAPKNKIYNNFYIKK